MSNGKAPLKPTDLRGILKYVPRFQDQIFVIAVDGSIVTDENFSNLLIDIAVLRSLNIKVVIVHGIGQQIQEMAARRNLPISDFFGTGATDADTLELATMASSSVSHVIFEGLTQNGLKAAVTNAVRAVPMGIIRGVDHEFTGKVDRIDREFLLQLITHQVVPIVQPIGFDRDGHSLRINSDLLAAELAEALQASKIIFLAPQPGLEIDDRLERAISVDDLRQTLETRPDAIDATVRSKAAHAVKAIETGTARVHLLDGRVFDGLLTEIFSNEGIGTLIYGNEYQQIRQATKRDVRLIYNLTRQAVKREELLYRTQQAIEKNIDEFFVYEIDENLIACVSLHEFAEDPEMAEIGSLYVMPFYQNRGIGKKMVDYGCLMAKERGLSKILALSTQSFSFFMSVCNFEEADKSVLPDSRLKSYEDSGRNSKILLKKL
ncbi:MAG: amino-acid N-acetyltransferase [Opitutaceae bacterium]|nr:amino-acid N-acetyltransferase [Opitutaceae bacterium]